ncbi:MAG TPA: response regulator transcription factor [Gaiellales bacterium]|nr:response regulator transcription factor [Gaiellales bacterium]
MSPLLSCVVADDHPAVLAAVSDALESANIEVVARVGDGEQALAQIEACHPAVALLDIRMPGMTGIEVARRIEGRYDTDVILFTGHGEPALVVEALDAGVRGIVLKEAPLEDLLRAIRLVASGSSYIDAALVGELASSDAMEAVPALTKRERDVLRLLADGFRNEEIGSHLFISPFTVRNHVERVMAKLDANSRTQAVATALRRALIT